MSNEIYYYQLRDKNVADFSYTMKDIEELPLIIKAYMEGMPGKDEFLFTITSVLMTPKNYEALSKRE